MCQVLVLEPLPSWQGSYVTLTNVRRIDGTLEGNERGPGLYLL